jgi:RNA methyltransferase, TrmH family
VPDLTSTANPRVKALVRLRSRRAREDAGVTLVEGHDELRLALDAGMVPRELWWAPDLARDDDLLDEVTAAGTRIVSVSRTVFEKVAYREGADGWLAVAPTPGHALAALGLREPALVLVAEGIEKPGNLGALLRNVEAFGADALVSAGAVTDLGNPNVVRASKGTVFAVPSAAATSDEAVAWARHAGLRLVVTTPAATTPLAAVDLAGPTALVIGSEATGVTGTWLDAADETVVIPMAGRVNSLNASTSGALALYEANRQRSAASDRP